MSSHLYIVTRRSPTLLVWIVCCIGLLVQGTACYGNAAQRFYRVRLGPPAPSFSFTYNGKSSDQLLGGWVSNQTEVALDAQRVQRTTVYSDPMTGLQVTCQAIQYNDFPADEWVLYFKNTGTSDTPVLEGVNALDLTLHRENCGEFTLYYAKGCSAQVNDFEPFQAELAPNMDLTFAPTGGRSSQDTAFPYYNIQRPDGTGYIMAVGWSGEWTATFARDGTTNLNVQAGMQLTHLVLHPGEEIRTPSILMMAYEGNRMSGQNLFRKLMEEHYTPTVNGQTVKTPIAASSAGYISFNSTTVTNTVQAIRNIASNQFPVDTYWIDAGWFPYTNSWEFGTGNWFADPARYPNGMEPVANAAHTNGMKFLLWFEPERVMPGTALYNSHPDWLLSGNVTIGGVPCYLLNLGNATALNWAETNFLGMITNIGVDIFRIDMNMEPLNYWRGNDPTNRQGITEIKYITGLYSFLDYLRSNDPSLLIDNSSAAGHRLDFEFGRRAIPLLRTDYLWDPVGAQCMEYALSFWLPYQGQGAVALDPYDFRSGLGETAVYAFNYGLASDPWWSKGAYLIGQYKAIKQYYLGDFYPLTPYDTNNNVWLAYQFDRPDLMGGMVQAFRRGACDISSQTLPLFGLDPNGRYAVTNFDGPGVTYMSGSNLMNQGLPVRIPAQPGAVIYAYHKLNQ